MKDRLTQFLQLEQLSPARFADMLGVQRSGVSHILSGRNKPGFDFIEKVLTRFPGVNVEWLITGKGKMYKEASLTTPAADLFTMQAVPAVQGLFETPEDTVAPAPAPVSVSAKETSRQVAKIVIFYTDKTFSEYLPE